VYGAFTRPVAPEVELQVWAAAEPPPMMTPVYIQAVGIFRQERVLRVQDNYRSENQKDAGADNSAYVLACFGESIWTSLTACGNFCCALSPNLSKRVLHFTA